MTEQPDCNSENYNEGYFICELPKGHKGNHQMIMEWDDEDERLG